MIDEPRLGLAPMGAMPTPMLFWAGMFTMMYAAASAMIVLGMTKRV